MTALGTDGFGRSEGRSSLRDFFEVDAKHIVLATRNLVDLAETFEVEALVMISTDKAVNPTSVMGSCKRLAEQYVQAKAATSPCRR